MNKSFTAAVTAMLLVTSSAWGASPEGQQIRPTGDNQPDPSPTEQARQADDPVPMDEERVKGNRRQGQQPRGPENDQNSLDEYDNPDAAGEEPDEDSDD